MARVFDMPSIPAADDALDITTELCPMTYVRTRLALDRLLPGQVLRVRLRGADPARNVPASAIRQGHAVLAQQAQEDGTIVLLLRRGPAYPPGAGESASRNVSASDPSA